MMLSSRGVYTFRKEAELQEILVKNCEKIQSSIEILIKKSQIFLDFYNIFIILGQNEQNFGRIP